MKLIGKKVYGIDGPGQSAKEGLAGSEGVIIGEQTDAWGEFWVVRWDRGHEESFSKRTVLPASKQSGIGVYYDDIFTKEQLTEFAQEYHGKFIYGDYQCFADLDGTYARQYLESKGFNVIVNYDTGYNGLALTDCGIRLSTNGHIVKLDTTGRQFLHHASKADQA